MIIISVLSVDEIMQEELRMVRKVGDSGPAAVLDGAQIKRLIKIAGTTNHPERDQTVITLSYWLGLRAKELASLRVGDVYTDAGSVKPVLHLKSTYTKKAKIRDVYLSSDVVQKRLKGYWLESASKFDPLRPLFLTRSGKAFSANGIMPSEKRLTRFIKKNALWPAATMRLILTGAIKSRRDCARWKMSQFNAPLRCNAPA